MPIAQLVENNLKSQIEKILTEQIKENFKKGFISEEVFRSEILKQLSININFEGGDIGSILQNTDILINYLKEANAIHTFGNGVIVCCGIMSGGSSALRMTLTQDRKARALYSVSILFSATAIGSAFTAAMAKKCEISPLAICSEAMGYGFLKLGDEARLMAEQVQGRSIWRKPRRPLSFLKGNNRNAGFIMPGDNLNTDLLSQKVLTVLAITFTLYGYGKFLIKSYKYGQKLCRKISQKRRSSLRKKRSILIRKQVTFLILCFSLSKRKTKYYSKSNFSLFGT
jgi:hypothetical protein